MNIPPTPESSTPSGPSSTNSRSARSQKVLACVLCQQRKVKCDRKFPCANCVRFKVECVPSALHPRRRRRRFPERDLLDRVRQYEALLRQNKIEFDPMHQDPAAENKPLIAEDDYDSLDGLPDSITKNRVLSPSAAQDRKGPREPKDIWHAMTQQGVGLETHSTPRDNTLMISKVPEPENGRESSTEVISQEGIQHAWGQLFKDNESVLPFGPRETAVELSALHPNMAHLFKLWQIYLDSVDPLLKVTHAPSLQKRITEAASNMSSMEPPLEALMFSIYSTSVMSLAVDDCQTAFGTSKDSLLKRYQFGCQRALLKCDYLRTDDRECLTALYLFLLSIRPKTDPRSLSSMLGMAQRIAHRIGIHKESFQYKRSAFEIEMRRRLWWSFEMFDSRIGELADYKNIAMTSDWNCETPANLNDSDLRLEMKRSPPSHAAPTEAIFVVVHSAMRDFVRKTNFYRDFHTPAVRPTPVRSRQQSTVNIRELAELEKTIEEKYLRHCIPDNPLHFLTIWTARAYLAKFRLVEHYSRYLDTSRGRTTTQRDAALRHALDVLEADTKVMTSSLTKSYMWMMDLHFALPAYIHILQDLKKRPMSRQSMEAWDIVSENFKARFPDPQSMPGPLLCIFTRLVNSAWRAYLDSFATSGGKLRLPKIVSTVKDAVQWTVSPSRAAGVEESHSAGDTSMIDEDPSVPTTTDFDNAIADYYAGLDLGFPKHFMPEIDLDLSDLFTMTWNCPFW